MIQHHNDKLSRRFFERALWRRFWPSVGLGVLLLVAAGMQVAGKTPAPEPSVRAVMSQDLANMPGKEALLLEVTYPPGGADPVHRHDAHGIVYVLEGSIVMGVKGGKEVTLGPGQAFYEGPNDIHTVGHNSSNTAPARFIVLLVKDKGIPPVLPAE